MKLQLWSLSSLSLSLSLSLFHPPSLILSIPSSSPAPLDGLLKMLYMILLHQAMRHPGAPKSAPHAPPTTPSTGSLPEADISSVTLALQTLGSFNFGGNRLPIIFEEMFQWLSSLYPWSKD